MWRLTQVIVVIKCVVSILLSMNILEQCVPMPMIRRVYVLSMYVIPTFHDLSNNTVHVSLKNDPIITLDTCSKEQRIMFLLVMCVILLYINWTIMQCLSLCKMIQKLHLICVQKNNWNLMLTVMVLLWLKTLVFCVPQRMFLLNLYAIVFYIHWVVRMEYLFQCKMIQKLLLIHVQKYNIN